MADPRGAPKSGPAAKGAQRPASRGSAPAVSARPVPVPPVPKARVVQPDAAADLALNPRQEQQRHAVERFNHKTFRSDWDALLRELFARVVDGCPFAVGLFTRDARFGAVRLRSMLNYGGGKEQMVDYVLRHFKLGHYQHIAGSLEGLAPHERFDLYKIVSPGLGLPLNSLVYKIEHYSNPGLKAVIVFGGERLGGQMEVHLKMTAGLLEQPAKSRAAASALAPGEPRYAELIAALRATDAVQLKQTGLAGKRLAEIREIVTGLGGIEDQFPQALKAKYVLLSKLIADQPAAPESSAPGKQD